MSAGENSLNKYFKSFIFSSQAWNPVILCHVLKEKVNKKCIQDYTHVSCLQSDYNELKID